MQIVSNGVGIVSLSLHIGFDTVDQLFSYVFVLFFHFYILGYEIDIKFRHIPNFEKI